MCCNFRLLNQKTCRQTKWLILLHARKAVPSGFATSFSQKIICTTWRFWNYTSVIPTIQKKKRTKKLAYFSTRAFFFLSQVCKKACVLFDTKYPKKTLFHLDPIFPKNRAFSSIVSIQKRSDCFSIPNVQNIKILRFLRF